MVDGVAPGSAQSAVLGLLGVVCALLMSARRQPACEMRGCVTSVLLHLSQHVHQWFTVSFTRSNVGDRVEVHCFIVQVVHFVVDWVPLVSHIFHWRRKKAQGLVRMGGGGVGCMVALLPMFSQARR